MKADASRLYTSLTVLTDLDTLGHAMLDHAMIWRM